VQPRLAADPYRQLPAGQRRPARPEPAQPEQQLSDQQRPARLQLAAHRPHGLRAGVPALDQQAANGGDVRSSQPPRRLGCRFLAQHHHPLRPHLPQQPRPAAGTGPAGSVGSNGTPNSSTNARTVRAQARPSPSPASTSSRALARSSMARKAGSIPTARRSTSGAPTARASRPARTRTRRRWVSATPASHSRPPSPPPGGSSCRSRSNARCRSGRNGATRAAINATTASKLAAGGGPVGGGNSGNSPGHPPPSSGPCDPAPPTQGSLRCKLTELGNLRPKYRPAATLGTEGGVFRP